MQAGEHHPAVDGVVALGKERPEEARRLREAGRIGPVQRAGERIGPAGIVGARVAQEQRDIADRGEGCGLDITLLAARVPEFRYDDSLAILPGHAREREASALEKTRPRLGGADAGRRFARAVVQRMRNDAPAVGDLEEQRAVGARCGRDEQDAGFVHCLPGRTRDDLLEVRNPVCGRDLSAYLRLDAVEIHPVVAPVRRLLLDLERDDPCVDRQSAQQGGRKVDTSGFHHCAILAGAPIASCIYH